MTLIVIVVVGIEIVDCVIARKDRKRFEKMTPEDLRKYQEKERDKSLRCGLGESEEESVVVS